LKKQKETKRKRRILNLKNATKIAQETAESLRKSREVKEEDLHRRMTI